MQMLKFATFEDFSLSSLFYLGCPNWPGQRHFHTESERPGQTGTHIAIQRRQPREEQPGARRQARVGRHRFQVRRGLDPTTTHSSLRCFLRVEDEF